MDDAGIYARDSPLLDCAVQVGIAQGRVISVSFPRTPEDDAEADHELLDRIEAYLEGVEEDFTDVTVALTVPTDQREVLETVRGIPYGTQIGVEKITSMAPGLDPESEDDQRLVREALQNNPAPLLIPDHRVRDGPSAAPAEVAQKLRSIEGL
ncbi:MGMT family protein [Halorientalis salina]|uniref:MGMT family protein n=1 Tax=Halorientalis salina TaxID=2932266 RepID=UPI0010AD1456|nr:MGMT family protein [Halorientalis salina]